MDLSDIKNDPSMMRMLYNEIHGMKALDHPNIVRLQEVTAVSSRSKQRGQSDAINRNGVELRVQHAGMRPGFQGHPDTWRRLLELGWVPYLGALRIQTLGGASTSGFPEQARDPQGGGGA